MTYKDKLVEAIAKGNSGAERALSLYEEYKAGDRGLNVTIRRIDQIDDGQTLGGWKGEH